MRAQHLHHQPVAREFLHAVTPRDFVPMNLGGRVMKEDSCWEECESEYEESLSSYDLACFGDVGCE